MELEDWQYSKINPLRFSPQHILEREAWRCVHGHTGMTHPACYNKEFGIQERKGATDIEAGALDADFALVLSWCIKTIGKDEIWYDHITKEDLDKGIFDSRIVGTFVEHLWLYDRIVVHYGKPGYFDLPFVLARYLWLKARGFCKDVVYPTHGMLWVSDTYTMSKRCLKISSRRQGSVANVVQGQDIKTRIEKDYWMKVQYGSKKDRAEALDYILDHNMKDVLQLEGNYLLLLPYNVERRTSI